MTTDTDQGLIAYEDGDDIIICDRKNPKAWIRSDTVFSMKDAEHDQMSSLH